MLDLTALQILPKTLAAFWKYVGSRLKTKKTVHSLINSDGNFAHSDQGKANTLNKFFSEVFVGSFVYLYLTLQT